MIEILRKCLTLLDADKRGRWVALVALTVTAGVFEAVGAVLIFSVLSMVGDSKNRPQVPIIGDVQSHFPGTSPDVVFRWLALGVALFFLLRAVVLVLQVYLQTRIAQNAGVRLAQRLLLGYLYQDYLFHVRTNSAILVRNVNESVHSVVNQTFVPLISLASEAVVITSVVVVLAVTSPLATLAGGVFVTTLLYVSLRVLRPKMSALGGAMQEASAAAYQTLQQSLEGIREVKLFGREQYFVDDYSRQRARMARSYYVNAGLLTLPRQLIETSFVLGLLVFLAIARGQGSTGDTLAVLGLFAYAVLRILPSVNRVILALGSVRFGGAAMDDVHHDLVTMRDAREAREAVPQDVAPVRLSEAIRLADVSYRYSADSEDVLHHLDLEIRRGEFIGIVGQTGSGKSTLVDLVAGLLQPTSGSITIDGIALDGVRLGWQRSIGLVSQTSFLTDDTLRHNIAFGLSDAEVDDDRVADAVRIASLGEFVSELPGALETVVGERGTRLSGGQRQRVTIARAVYRQPEVLIFDEGTASLDRVTEAAVMQALESLRGDRTVIAVAHRLATVRTCDRIVLLDAGRVIDIGTYDELVHRNEAFRKLAE